MKQFLDKYDTVIFDMDGVITSEEMYWDAAALTVDEMIKSSKYFGKEDYNAQLSQTNIAGIRARIFADDALISLLKNKGVNSNWDLAYITLLMCLSENTDKGEELIHIANELSDDIFKTYKDLEAGASVSVTGLWDTLHDCFQEWVLGREEYIRIYGREPLNCGKKGLMYDEKPLLPLCDITDVLSKLSQTKRLCIGTGRPQSEIVPQLKKWDIIKYFDADGIVTYDEVVSAQDNFRQKLCKPHPYVFLKALMGKSFDDDKIISGEYDKDAICRTLVVGDAGADLFASQAMGADFCAVLTGVMREKARRFFEINNAGYILNSVCDIF